MRHDPIASLIDDKWQEPRAVNHRRAASVLTLAPLNWCSASMAFLRSGPDALLDGRQSAAAFEICRGVTRLLRARGMAAISEVCLANGRRADVAALGEAGEVWIAEIKSSIEDFRADHKWPDYREYCDCLFFAVAPGFPDEILPADTGLIIADRYGGEIIRSAPEHKLAAARRKSMTLRVAQTAAHRLQAAIDPEFRLELISR